MTSSVQKRWTPNSSRSNTAPRAVVTAPMRLIPAARFSNATTAR